MIQIRNTLTPIIIVWLLLASPFVLLAQDETPVPDDQTTVVPYGTETNPLLRGAQMFGDAVNSFAGGATFMALLLWLTGKLSSDKRVISLLENATQGLRDSYPPETRQWIVDLGSAIRNVGVTIEEVFDDIPVEQKE